MFNPNIQLIGADPIRSWVKTVINLGATHLFTIGLPDPLPKEILEKFANAEAEETLKGSTSYPELDGHVPLKNSIMEMENNFGSNFTEDDFKLLFASVGASQALQFYFSLFQDNTDVMVSTPCWGTVLSMIRHTGKRPVQAHLFENGKFVEENAEKALTKKTRCVYINVPSNPTGTVLPKKAMYNFSNWAVSHNLQIVSDSPYKYLIYDMKKTPYYCPSSLGDDINANTTCVSSFSKIIKPDIRTGFFRLSPSMFENGVNLIYYFRNLSAGLPTSIQAGVNAVIENDPKLSYLKPITRAYQKKYEIAKKHLERIGCRIPEKPEAGFLFLAKTPNNEDGEAFVRRVAQEYQIGFVPGCSVGGNSNGFEYLKQCIRVGVGGGWTAADIERVLSQLK